jgi:hypothetical protein
MEVIETNVSSVMVTMNLICVVHMIEIVDCEIVDDIIRWSKWLRIQGASMLVNRARSIVIRNRRYCRVSVRNRG